jgi:hypothetical protein
MFRFLIFTLFCLSGWSAAAQGYPRANWVATLSTLQHRVSGTVTIVDERTLRLDNFNYDGTAPAVYVYATIVDSRASQIAGRSVGPELKQALTNASFTVQLPLGQTLDAYGAVSIWCADFRVNFGSGTFKAPAEVPPTPNPSPPLTDLQKADAVFSWAQTQYANYLMPRQENSVSADGHYFRFYPATNNALTFKDGRVSYVTVRDGALSFADVGALADLFGLAAGVGAASN